MLRVTFSAAPPPPTPPFPQQEKVKSPGQRPGWGPTASWPPPPRMDALLASSSPGGTLLRSPQTPTPNPTGRRAPPPAGTSSSSSAPPPPATKAALAVVSSASAPLAGLGPARAAAACGVSGRAATGHSTGGAVLWAKGDGGRLAPRALLRGHAGQVTALAWLRDGDRLVTAARDGSLRAWHGATGLCLRAARLPAGCALCALCPLPDSDTSVALACLEGGVAHVLVWDITTPRLAPVAEVKAAFLGGVPALHAVRAPEPALLLSGPALAYHRWAAPLSALLRLRSVAGPPAGAGPAGARSPLRNLFGSARVGGGGAGAGELARSDRQLTEDGRVMLVVEEGAWSLWTREDSDQAATGCFNVPLLDERRPGPSPRAAAVAGLVLRRHAGSGLVVGVQEAGGAGWLVHVGLVHLPDGTFKEGSGRVVRSVRREAPPGEAAPAAWTAAGGCQLRCVSDAADTGLELACVDDDLGWHTLARGRLCGEGGGAAAGAAAGATTGATVSTVVLPQGVEEPWMVLEGFRDGAVAFTPLAALLLPGGGATPRFAGHAGAVTAVAHTPHVRSGLGPHTFVSGGEDGWVVLWAATGAECLQVQRFLVHDGAVRRLLNPPHSVSMAWHQTVLSCGEDGLVAVVDFGLECVVRGFPGHLRAPHDIVWDGNRGLLGCLSKLQPDEGAEGGVRGEGAGDAVAGYCLVVWDTVSCSRDRVLWGQDALGAFEAWKAANRSDLAEEGVEHQAPAFLFEGCRATVAAMEWVPDDLRMDMANYVLQGADRRAAGDALHLAPVTPDCDLVVIDLERIVHKKLHGEDPHSHHSGGETPVNRSLLSCLLALHCWGLDEDLDATVLHQLVPLCLKAPPPPAEGVPPAGGGAALGGRVLGALVGHGGNVSIAWPAPGGADFWREAPDFVSLRLMAISSIAKHSIETLSLPPVLQTCSMLATFYALTFPTLTRCPPNLNLFATYGLSSNSSTRESSFILMKAGVSTLGEEEAMAIVREVVGSSPSSIAKDARQGIMLNVAGLVLARGNLASSVDVFGKVMSLLTHVACNLDAELSALSSHTLVDCIPSEKWKEWRGSKGSEFAQFLASLFESSEEIFRSNADMPPSSPLGAGIFSGKRDVPAPKAKVKPSMRYMIARQQLSEVLVSAATADFRTFLKTLGKKMTAHQTLPGLHTNMMALVTVLKVVQRSPVMVLENLQLAVMVILCALDPVRPDIRKQSLQGVTMIVRGLCQQFPVVDFHSKSMWLAVGQHASDTSGAMLAGAALEPVAVYDLTSSAKIRVLVSESGEETDMGVSAIKFGRNGSLIAGYCKADNCIRIWSLKESWQQRFSRNATVIKAAKVIFVTAAVDDKDRFVSLKARRSSKAVQELPWRLNWKSQSELELLKYNSSIFSSTVENL